MNKRFIRVIIALAVSLLAPVGLGMPVLALGGNETGGDSHKTTTPPPSQPVGSKTPETTPNPAELEKEHAAELETEHVNKLAKTNEGKFRSRAKDLLDEAKKDGTSHTKEERLKNCTEKKVGLEKKVANIKSNSAKHLAKIDNVLKTITESQTDTSTPISGLDSLLAAANKAKTTASASVQALSTLTPTIDCSKDTVATDIATFKAAAEQARGDLKAYRDTVKVVLNAIENATHVTPVTNGGN